MAKIFYIKLECNRVQPSHLILKVEILRALFLWTMFSDFAEQAKDLFSTFREMYFYGKV